MHTLTVVIEQALAPVPGGTGRYARQITQALATAAPAGWRVRSVSGWHRDVTAARIDGVPGPARLPVPGRLLNEVWLRGLPPWVDGDRVHATTPLAPPAPWLRARRTQPMVVTVHDTVPWTHPETLTPRGVRWHRLMVERAADTADALVVPTRVVAAQLSELFPAAADRIHVVGHGVTALDDPADAGLRAERLGLPPRYVLSLATVEPRKGLDVLVEAMAQVPDAALVVVGQAGWGSVDLQQWADIAGLDRSRVHLLGRIDDTDLATVLHRAAVLAVPSRAEGFGLPVLEGLAAGVPVVHSDAPALVEVGADATAVVPVGDSDALAAALSRILTDDDLAADLRERGRKRATDFTWAAAAEALWNIHQPLR